MTDKDKIIQELADCLAEMTIELGQQYHEHRIDMDYDHITGTPLIRQARALLRKIRPLQYML